jgi:hypothetical protein
MNFNVTMQENKWVVKEVDLLFSAPSTARNFTIAKKSVANIVFSRNDRLWISVEGQTTTRVTLDPGVYSGTQLAAELKSKLDAAFSDLSVTFTVVLALGKFTITNSGGLDMTFYYVNERTGTRRNSTIAENIGLTADQGPSTSIVSDTVIDIDSSYEIIAQTGNTAASYILTDELTMDSDSALNITTNTAASLTVTAKVTYESQ